MIKVTVANTQQVKAAIQKALNEFTDEGFVTIGIHEDAGNHQDAGITNATLGATLHYGTEHIPARPFLDIGVKQHERLYANEISSVAKSGGTLSEALNIVGEMAAGSVRLFMTELKSPPLKVSPRKTKTGGSNPLVDQGNLRGSVTYKVQLKKPSTGIA